MGKDEEAKTVFTKLGGHEALETLQVSPYHEVYRLASEILEKHYDATEMNGIQRDEFFSKNHTFNI
jgi:Atypical Arm repeat